MEGVSGLSACARQFPRQLARLVSSLVSSTPGSFHEAYGILTHTRATALVETAGAVVASLRHAGVPPSLST